MRHVWVSKASACLAPCPVITITPRLNPARSPARRSFTVSPMIEDPDRSVAIALGRSKNHSRAGLSPRVIGLRVYAFRGFMIGAGHDHIEPRAEKSKLFDNTLLNGLEIQPSEVTPADPRLVRNYDDGEGQLIGLSDRRYSRWDEAHVFGVSEVMHLLDDHAVRSRNSAGRPEKSRSFSRSSQSPHPSTRRRSIIVLPTPIAPGIIATQPPRGATEINGLFEASTLPVAAAGNCIVPKLSLHVFSGVTSRVRGNGAREPRVWGALTEVKAEQNKDAASPPKPATLITGATGGLGRALASVFARAGHSLVLVGRTSADLEKLAQDLRARNDIEVITCTCDLADPASIADLLAALRAKDVFIHTLVNNAGMGEGRCLLSISRTGDVQCQRRRSHAPDRGVSACHAWPGRGRNF